MIHSFIKCIIELISKYKKLKECINRGVREIQPPVASRAAMDVINNLSALIKLARKERKITQIELAERVGVSRATLQKVESGNPSIAIQTYFEAAIIVGVPLMGSNKEDIQNLSMLLSYISPLVPETIRGKQIDLDDDF